ncbi:TIGR04282 family arsenosugar biosynthesis glycosyltransferase [Rhodomicrobium sp. R_RK_3]|nr:TIGR04282 family arsenosugar biosynthesis glycosyltransferase [Rhodomicrobium sp. R_RK_3]
MSNERHGFSCAIAVMAKASEPGRAKTRLCPPLTPEEAAECNTAFLKDIADNLLAAGGTAPISGCMAYGPPGQVAFFERHLPAGIGLHEVWEPGFGQCLAKAMDVQFAAGHAAACVLNSDSPTLPPSILAEAASALMQPGDRIVLGASTDGGYYLLGCKTMHPRLFEEIAWSTEIVAWQTLERAAEIGVEVYRLPDWYDIDDAAALRLAAAELLDGHRFHPRLASSAAPHTAALLRRMRAEADLDRRLSPGLRASA